MKKLKNDLKILLRGYKLIFSIEAGLIPLNIVSAVFEALFPFISIYLGAEIINALSRGDKQKHIYILLIILLVLNLAIQQIKQIIARIINVKNQIFERKFQMHLNNKVLEMDYDHMENPDVHIKRQRIDDVRNMRDGGIWKLVYQSRDVVSSIIIIITSVAITYRAFTVYSTIPQAGFVNIIISPFSSAALLIFIVINTLLSIRFNASTIRKSFKIMNTVIPFNTLFGYILNNYVNSYHAGKDIRLYGQKDMITGNCAKLTDDIQPTLTNMERNQTKYTNINIILSSLISLLVYIFVGIKALYNLIGLGDLFKYISGIVKFSSGLNGFLNSFNELRVNNEYLEVLYDFLDLPDKMYQGTLPVEKRAFCESGDNDYEIEFRDVSFKYPSSESYALQHVSMKFKIGERLAVVGQNGSGKTTFIKLLCRLYDPTEGVILLNGIDIRKYDYAEYMSVFSVVFQDFKLFSFSLGQNVASSVEYDKSRVEACLKEAGLGERLKEMPEGLETCLYKDFDEKGVEISGGEAQKIALARALYKNAPFIVLDEPTAALDPIAEYEIYSKFNEIVGDKTAIYISHRLSSCRFCDDIAVFDNGAIVQRGSHDDLVNHEGKYQELWFAQAQYYTEAKVQ